jgi:F-type H+-transporting ATPase subunit b
MAEPTHKTTEQVPKGEHDGGFPPFNSQHFASQLVWLVIAFILLYALMSKLALPRIRSLIETRQKRVDDDIAEAGRLKAKSEAALTAYEKALADARANAQAIANQNRERQAAEAATRREALEDELNRKMAQAEKSIAATKNAAMTKVRGVAEDATRTIVERLIGTAPSEQAVTQAVAEVLKG